MNLVAPQGSCPTTANRHRRSTPATTTPRPYSRHNLIQGTNGVFGGFPNRIALEQGGMDHLMCWRIIDCLRNGEPMDQSVYDAAAWSVIGPISAESIADRSNSKLMPDFTRGVWRTTKPLPVVGGSA